MQIQNRPEQPLPVIGRAGPCRLEQIDRPRISDRRHPCQPSQHPEAANHDPDRNPAAKSCSAQQRWPARPACRARHRRRRRARIVVGTWGGDYARLLNKNIEEPILIKDGWEVVQDQAGDPERRSKMLAEQRLPRGTTDVQGLSALNMFQMHDAGIVDADRLRQAQERRQPAAVDEVSLRRRPHLFGQGRRLQSQADPDGARQLQGRVRSQARQQARHHRHPVPVHAGLRGARRRRQGQRSRARQEAAAGMQEGRHAHLSDQRGVRPGPEVGGIRHRRDVEGARRAMAERGHSA